MTLNFPDAVNNAISSEVIKAAAAYTGEQEAGIKKELKSAVPAIIAGIIGKIASPSGASQVIQLGKQAATTNILQQPTALFAKNDPTLEEKYHSILKEIMGDRATGIAHLVGAHAGISNSSAFSLLTFLAPFSISVLDKFARDNNISEISLATQLNNQKYKVLAALPAGIGPIAGMLGFQVPESISAAAAELPHSRYDSSIVSETTVEEESKVMKILLPLFLGILLVVLAVYFFKGWRFDNKFDKVTSKDTIQPVPVLFTGHHPVVNAEPLYTGPPMTILELPNGTVMKVMKDDFEEKLVNFLQSDYTGLGNDSLKNIWFDINNLRFNNSSGELIYSSQRPLVNLISILTAFPAARIKIGVHTDKAGNESDNLKFSASEAKSVQAVLINAGLRKQVMGADGYGSAFAKFPATAPETNRMKDRRVSVSVRM